MFAELANADDEVAADALRLMLLTGTSADDVRGADWSDIDVGRKVWRVRPSLPARGPIRPPSRRIALHDAAIMLLDGLRAGRSATGALFPTAPGMARLERTWSAAAHRAGVDVELAALPPTLATDVFAGLAPELTRSLLGIDRRVVVER
jgi:integrase